MTDIIRKTSERPAIDKVDLHEKDDDAGSWVYTLLLGLDMDRGWCLEFDMVDGELISALTPAGQDPILHMQVSEKWDAELGLYRSTVTINAESDDVVWDEKTKTLRIEG